MIAGLGVITALLESFSGLAQRLADLRSGASRSSSSGDLRWYKGEEGADHRSDSLQRHRALEHGTCDADLLQRMSGISTLTQEFVKGLAGTNTRVVDTRKTIPGLRALDKYAVCCGGGLNRRADLEDGILIKHNHAALGGGIAKVLEKALRLRKDKQPVEVEVRTHAERNLALAGGAQSVVLDGMTPAAVKEAVKQVRTARPEVRIEAAGGVTLLNVRQYALAGVDFVSVGAITHSAAAVDLNMRIAVDAS